MANVYIEARPQGRPEESRVDDYVLKSAGPYPRHVQDQHNAIDWAKKNGHAPLVARVRHLNDKRRPDHWRAD